MIKDSKASGYVERQQRRSREYQEEGRKDLRDCGPLPNCKNRIRRNRAKNDFPRFCKTYFPSIYTLPWSTIHYAAADRIQKAILNGGLFAFAMPRGSGKTSLCESATLWALLYDHLNFVVLIGATELKSEERLKSIRSELAMNDKLGEDFPEVCHPIRSLGNAWKTAEYQTLDTNPTHITWKNKQLILPTVWKQTKGGKKGKAYPTSGSVLMVSGITGDIRGITAKRAYDGAILRPKLAIGDDPQTRESAKSPAQSETRAQTLAGDIAYLSGPGEPISVLVPCTVIYGDDMADRMLNRELHPEYQGIRTEMVISFPERENLWTKYQEIQQDSLRNDGDGSEATEFYRANRKEMDLGSEVSWPERHAPKELSGIQHAMNLKIRDEAAFWSEMQNQPMETQGDNDVMASIGDILAKTTDYQRYLCPRDTTTLTAFVDVQKNCLAYMLVAWAPNFVGQIIDYNLWPESDSKHRTISKSDTRNTFEKILGGKDLQKHVYAGLRALTSELSGQTYPIDGGGETRISRILIDANWGQLTNTVYQFCRESQSLSPVMPYHGKYVGASSQPWSSWKRKRGERVGAHWRVRPSAEWPIKHALTDVNHWKVVAHALMKADFGGDQTVGIFGRNANGKRVGQRYHTELADQICAEFCVRTESKLQSVFEWKLKSVARDNEMLDCLVGNCVAGSMEGIEMANSKTPERRSRKNVSGAEFKEKYLRNVARSR